VSRVLVAVAADPSDPLMARWWRDRAAGDPWPDWSEVPPGRLLTVPRRVCESYADRVFRCRCGRSFVSIWNAQRRVSLATVAAMDSARLARITRRLTDDQMARFLLLCESVEEGGWAPGDPLRLRVDCEGTMAAPCAGLIYRLVGWDYPSPHWAARTLRRSREAE
jgi:hypothetical protein